jgi:hypothetical protein
MHWLLRPSILVLVLAALVLGAAALALWPWGAETQPRPQPVTGADQEVAWLYPATNASTWERFVTAVQNAAERADLGLAVDSARAFPPETTAVPEVALLVAGGRGRLLFRWYKLTSDWKTEKWVQALSRRAPPPLAVIGGSSSDPAIELANCLQDQYTASGKDGSTPLLLLTTATADWGQGRDGSAVRLTELYDGRTYRFCFTNKQMAEAVTDFVWSQEALRPDGDPFYLAPWKDDGYSMDLAAWFINTIEPHVAARSAARAWAWQAGVAAQGGLGLEQGWAPGRWTDLAEWEPIYCGVGTFNQPNRWEAEVAESIMAKRRRDPARRAVLVLPAASAQPARRFLRGLMRTAPAQARRFVVLTGDAIAFSTIYRDRNVAWPIQDLPFDLVFFCHRNPADAQAGFQAEGDPAEGDRAAPAAASDSPGGTGTEDVLLFGDIVEALALAALRDGTPVTSADEVGRRLAEVCWLPDGRRVGPGPEGFPLFSQRDLRGNRHSGTGEHIVWLQPHGDQGRIQPQATITVWSLLPEDRNAPHEHPHPGRSGHWQRSREPLRVDYEMMKD